jgi:hypothetical protein
LDSEFKTALDLFVSDVENPITNFNLARQYDRLGNTSSALTHYIKCAERSEDLLLSYESLIRTSICLESQGSRGFTQSHLLRQAICILPTRPEAYFFLCKYLDSAGEKYDCYLLANIALSVCDYTSPPLAIDYYLGREGIEFCKAVSGIMWDKDEESMEIFNRLAIEAQSEYIRELCKANLKAINNIS